MRTAMDIHTDDMHMRTEAKGQIAHRRSRNSSLHNQQYHQRIRRRGERCSRKLINRYSSESKKQCASINHLFSSRDPSHHRRTSCIITTTCSIILD
jgi:hypothetical protein